jgi:hypothetical protein
VRGFLFSPTGPRPEEGVICLLRVCTMAYSGGNQSSMSLPMNDPVKLQKLFDGFYHYSSGILDRCVMAINGFGVATRQPYKTEVNGPKDYQFWKGRFAIIVLEG